MNRWLVALGLLAALGYFGIYREVEARCFRRTRCAPANAPVVACSTTVPGPTTTVITGHHPVVPIQPPGTVAPGGPGVAPGTAGPTTQTPATPGTGSPRTPEPRLPTPKPGKLHAVLLVDDKNKETGTANQKGAARMEMLLRTGVPANRLGSLITLAGDALAPDQLRKTLAELPVASEDTLLCYYSGTMVYEDGMRGYLLIPAATAKTAIARSDLRNMLVDRKPRLTVLLTDAPVNKVQPENLRPLAETPGEGALSDLLFKHKGLVDWHASASSELAFPRADEGGLFTLNLGQELSRPATTETPATWANLLDRVRQGTDQLYREYRRVVLESDKIPDDAKLPYREQDHQTPSALSPLDQVQPYEPPSVADTNVTEMIVFVPDGAKLWIEDRPTRQTGKRREFATDLLEPGKVYKYNLRAEIPRGESLVSQSREVMLKAGDRLEVRFEP